MHKVLSALITLFFIQNTFAQVSTSRKYDDVKTYLENLVKRNPQNASMFTLGFSNAGVEIKGIKIGDGPIHNLVVGTHHGNEYGSTELALGFADSIASSPITGQTLYVIPVLNIDGFNNRRREEHVNSNYLDINRDYPGPCATEGPFNSRSTKALADFIAAENIVASATLHTYWPAVVYPWGISTNDTATPYDNEFTKMARNATEFSRYGIGNATEVIYPADGTYEDYSFWKHGIWTLLFEVGRSHNPNMSDLNKLVQDSVPGMRKMFENAPTTRAEKHEFTGRCDTRLRALDLHIE